MTSLNKSTLVIGIDFGTTFSGVSWMFCREDQEHDQPEVISRWPSALARNSDRLKVPSKIHYEQDTGAISWGYDISSEVEPLQWFKLLLLEPHDMQGGLYRSSHVKNARRMMVELNKNAVVVIGDYLGQLWKHTLEIIETAKGRSLVRGTPIHVVLTIPAIWKDYARDRMRKAASLAGILDDRLIGETTLSFISEPEAAVLATLPELDGRGDLKAGDSFVVCDCGGGTVDIISYIVNQSDPFDVSECVEGDGALCGATFLDEDFLAFLRKSVGEVAWSDIRPAAIKKMINTEWEHGIKPNFTGANRPWMVDLPKGAKRAEISLQGFEIRKIFERVNTEIHKLVDSQVYAIKRKTHKPPKFVILVGGFGRCPFTFSSLKERHGKVVEILQATGDRPWSAICRGAALSGAAGRTANDETVQLGSRVSRLSYGWKFQTEFKKRQHNLEDRRWDGLRGRYVADNQMEWVLKRASQPGQDVSAKEPKTFKYNRNFASGTKGIKNCKFQLFTCAAADPPSRKDPSVIPSGELVYQTPVPVENLPRVKDRGTKYHGMGITMKMEISGASLDISVYVDGKRLTGKSLDISYD